jgi:glycosyltransferase involved in cell wall biosynthesis
MTDMEKARVSVLMPVYNREDLVGETIESILRQDFSDFEFIIINDGSTDNTDKVIHSFSDKRIHYFSNDANLGISRSRNKAFSLSRGEYIAVLDSDDVCLPARLDVQVKYLDEHQDIGVLGTAAQVIDQDNRKGKLYRMPSQHHMIMWELPFRSPFVHSSVMLRRSILEQINGYNEKRDTVVDYELWVRLRNRTRFANLDDVHLLYRQHAANITHMKSAEQMSDAMEIRRSVFEEELRKKVSIEVICQLQSFLVSPAEVNPKGVWVATSLIYQLERSFMDKPGYSRQEKREILQDALKKLEGVYYHRSRRDVRLIPAALLRSLLKLTYLSQ